MAAAGEKKQQKKDQKKADKLKLTIVIVIVLGKEERARAMLIITTPKIQSMLTSKYLGGDEEHTHLVKGLDKTLSEKVRRDEMLPKEPKEEEIDLDQIMEEASSAKAR